MAAAGWRAVCSGRCLSFWPALTDSHLACRSFWGMMLGRFTSLVASCTLTTLLLRSAMRRAGVDRLVLVGPALPAHLAHLGEAERLEAVAAMFPDRNHWIARLGRHLGTPDVAGLIERLGYTHEAELLSMRLCLWCANLGRGVLPARSVLVARLREYVAAHGMPPSPRVLLQDGPVAE
jgi:hypothetical protein